MRIALDFDGVICEGKYLVQPERAHETYMKLQPYDLDTPETLYHLTRYHECYIITSRSYNDARWSINEWLRQEIPSLDLAGIITAIEQPHKYHLAGIMGCDLIVDDSPRVWQCSRNGDRPEMLLMDNPAWPENQKCYDYTMIGQTEPMDTWKRVRSWKELETRIASLNSRLIQKS